MFHYHQKNMLNPLVKSVLKSLTINGDICNFVTAVFALSNTSKRGVYNYTRVADTAHWATPCAAFSSSIFWFGNLCSL